MSQYLKWSAAIGLLLLSLCACSGEIQEPGQPSPETSAAATSGPPGAGTQASPLFSATETETEAPPVVETPEDLQAAVDQLTRALQAPDAKSMSPLMLDSIWLAAGPVGDEGKSVSRSEALAWLGERWGSELTLVSNDYVEHFVLLEIETAGWAALPPVQNGTVLFHFHRYNAKGEEDPVQGSWRIDAIIYQ